MRVILLSNAAFTVAQVGTVAAIFGRDRDPQLETLQPVVFLILTAASLAGPPCIIWRWSGRGWEKSPTSGEWLWLIQSAVWAVAGLLMVASQLLVGLYLCFVAFEGGLAAVSFFLLFLGLLGVTKLPHDYFWHWLGLTICCLTGLGVFLCEVLNPIWI